ncbi:MAG TPA: Gfo/Idh/MocA family oxidoreductase, partial [Pirellulales bacterium]|nr:Gfo/Idh/MocA family oxidoreductase [Pirellulales bacterium]
MQHDTSLSSPQASRRTFMKGTTAAIVAGAVAGELSMARSAHAAGSDVLRIGLIGCGGRGTGAAAQALKADKNTKLVAMGDAFADALDDSVKALSKDKTVGDRIDVASDRRFVGFDAYQKVIDSGVDVVLLAAPPHFRPQHLQAAIDAGKHVFAEKPVAVDAPGFHKVLAAAKQAKDKNLALCSGLCWRYNYIARAAVEQVKEGAIGDIIAIEANYNSSPPGKPWPMVREPNWSDMEFQLRNWYWLTWLSGDHIVEQAVHSVDKASWVLGDIAPQSCLGLGGLQARMGDDRGQIFDHHAVTYDYPNGVKLSFNCRQQTGTSHDVSVRVYGTKGSCEIEKGEVRSRNGETTWKYRGPKNIMHQTEHDELFANLRSGKIVNDGHFMAMSTMLAIMGRMATYTGQNIAWDRAIGSREDLTPAQYAWGPAPNYTVAVPGV